MTGGLSGLRAWLLQRATAIYLGVFLAIALPALLLAPPQDHAGWRALIAGPWVQLAVALFLLSLALHAWIGLRDVLVDYLRPAGLRLAGFAAVILVLAGSTLWALRALLLAAPA